MLEGERSTVQLDILNDFCQTMIARQSANWPPEESVLAKELIDFFPSVSFLSPDSLREMSAALGIIVSFAKLPPELRGYNCEFEDTKVVVISTEQSFPGAGEHTLLHEIREILEATFENLGHPTISDKDDLEEHAESFAMLVRAEAIGRMGASFLTYAGTVQPKWARIAAHVFLGLFVCANLLSCALLPRLEDWYAQKLQGIRNARL